MWKQYVHPLHEVIFFIITFLITYVGCSKHPHTEWSLSTHTWTCGLFPTKVPDPDAWQISQGPGSISKFHHLLLCPQLIYFVPFGSWRIVWVLDGSEKTSKLWSLFRKKWAGYGQQEGPTNQGKHLDEALRWFFFWELDIFFWKIVTVTFIAAGEDVFLQTDEADILHTSSWTAQSRIFVQIFWRKWHRCTG